MANNSLVKVVSWNINGCGNPVKRKKVLSYLKLQHTDIAFIQETHLKDEEAKKFKRDWVGQVFFSSFSTKKNGVLILVHKLLNFSLVREFTDTNGRVICLDAIINGMKLTLCNVYAPNKEDPSFFHEVNKILGNAQGQVVLAGDFNQVLDGALDKSRFTGTVLPKDRAAIQMLMKDNGLIDAWRMVNPSKREYSFYSHCHKSYSRIDFILISQSLINAVTDCNINAISLSDHAPVELCLKLHPDKLRRGRWRMNTSILQDEVFHNELARDLSSFFDINMGSTDSVAMVWEASKAYIRGKIIAHTSRMKKEYINTVKTLESELITMERQLAEHYSDNLFNDICKCKIKIQEIFNKKAEYALFRLKTTFYEAGEKTGKLLARQLKEQSSAHVIPAIRRDGVLVTSPKEINEVFRQFYEKLYTSEGMPSESSLRNFFLNITLPKLSAEQADILDKPVSQDEVRKAIQSMKTGKSPGTDGFPVEYYKQYMDILIPVLTKVFEEAFQAGFLPPSLNEALISLIPKKGRDHTDSANFRPISLMNVDNKILAKVLALRLETVLPGIIHCDQVGFVRGRSSTDNLRRLMHLMWLNSSNTVPVAAISLDAEKAFDRVGWNFLHSALSEFGFGTSFMKWVKVLYSDPKAAVTTNGVISSFFNLSRGTRQGCPLSPLLFTIVLEPLAIAIRANLSIKGVDGGGSEHKLMLYADDILFLTSDPQNSLPVLMHIISEYSQLSGYKINWTKSEAMPISKHCHPHILTKYNFRWIPKGMVYLGIKISPDFSEMTALNYETLLQKIKTNIGKWGKLNLTLCGKINVVKMVIAPQFNYISMMLPLNIPDHIFKQYDNLIKEFLWAGRKPRFKMNKLFTPKSKGGLSLPNVRLYNLSFELAKIAKHWSGTVSDLGWVTIEQALATPFHPIQVLAQQVTGLVEDRNPVIQHSRGVWAKIHKLHKLSHYKQQYSSLWLNPELKIDKRTVFWKKWVENGIHTINDLYKAGVLKSFAELSQEYHLQEKGDFWKYLQIRHCLSKKIQLTVVDNPIVDCLQSSVNHRASGFYNNTVCLTSSSCEHLRLIWQRDLECNIDEDTWEHILADSGKYIREVRCKFIQFKILHRFYWTPSRLFRIGLINSSTCWKCKKETGTFLHLIWDCAMVKPFWGKILKFLETWITVNLPLCPRLCLLGDKSVIPRLTKEVHSVLMVGLASAARIILRHWKAPEQPTFQEWKVLMTETASYEVMLTRIRGKRPVELSHWVSFQVYLTSP